MLKGTGLRGREVRLISLRKGAKAMNELIAREQRLVEAMKAMQAKKTPKTNSARAMKDRALVFAAMLGKLTRENARLRKKNRALLNLVRRISNRVHVEKDVADANPDSLSVPDSSESEANANGPGHGHEIMSSSVPGQSDSESD